MKPSESTTGLKEPQGNLKDQEDPQALIRLSFKEVYDSLKDFLEHSTDLSEENLNQLFEVIMMSYFSRYEDTPHRILFDAVGHCDYSQDYAEGQNAEVALAILDRISQLAKHYFPQIAHPNSTKFLRGATLAEILGITNATVYGRDSVVISIPLREFICLQNEANNRSTSNRS